MSRSESAYTGLDKAPMKSLPKESISFAIEHIVVTSSEPVLQKYKNRLQVYNHNRIGTEGIQFYKRNYKEQLLSDGYITSQSGCAKSRFTITVHSLLKLCLAM